MVDTYRAGSTRRMDTPSPSKSNALGTVAGVVGNFPSGDLSYVYIRKATAVFGSRVRSVTVRGTKLSSVPVVTLGKCFKRALKTTNVVRTVVAVRSLGSKVVLPTGNFRRVNINNGVGVDGEVQRYVGPESFLGVVSNFKNYGTTLVCSGSGCYGSGYIGHLFRVAQCVRVSGRSYAVSNLRRDIYKRKGRLLACLCGSRVGSCPGFCGVSVLSGLLFATARFLLASMSRRSVSSVSMLLFGTASSVLTSGGRVRACVGRSNFFPDPSIFLCALPGVTVKRVAVERRVGKRAALCVLGSGGRMVVSGVLGTDGFTKGVVVAK